MDIQDLKKKNVNFKKKWLDTDPDYFEKLTQGQDPDFLVLACSDSRVCPTTVTEMEPGHMFIHRNVANQVVESDESFAAGLYYALVHLKVKYVLINGHTNCGGVQAAWENNDEEGLQGWLKYVKDSMPDPEATDKEWTLEKLAKFNVMVQMKRLQKHPVFQEHGEGVSIIGALFDLKTGSLDVFDPDNLTEEDREMLGY
ncbi:carbonate dehydratase [Alteribacter lacisalsi]|uniref:carbonic anhydrase n=1 Tax=Alteribacter lacisalsi TaxID=2045244 RepID=A0A2W0H4S6_9BACI|nr:carbonic anhydrase [Alteribacter lacisalsi]PYZ96834.1 carbonate dehydratase [Alteribacter lacisalsi]